MSGPAAVMRQPCLAYRGILCGTPHIRDVACAPVTRQRRPTCQHQLHVSDRVCFICVAVCAVQWCAIERAPRQYSWMGYKQLFEMVRAVGLKLQVVLSFHACGGNVGDMAQVPLPPWVLQVRHQGGLVTRVLWGSKGGGGGVKLQTVLSFHACGGNIGDMAQGAAATLGAAGKAAGGCLRAKVHAPACAGRMLAGVAYARCS